MIYYKCLLKTGGGGGGDPYSIVVTCSQGLAGLPITCSDGTTSTSETCPSTAPYTVTFSSLAAGTYTVSATVSGQTFSEQVIISDTDSLNLYALDLVSVSVTSAKGDVLTYTDIYGNTQTITFNDNQTTKTVVFELFKNQSQSFTFTSNIAKSTSDITVPYTKTITFTNSTTEAKIMPDGALYWYGYEAVGVSKFLENSSKCRVIENQNSYTLSTDKAGSGAYYANLCFNKARTTESTFKAYIGNITDPFTRNLGMHNSYPMTSYMVSYQITQFSNAANSIVSASIGSYTGYYPTISHGQGTTEVYAAWVE